MHYRYENARRDRVYGKPIPGMRVDTSELADRVGTVVFPSGMYRPIELFFFDRRLGFAMSLDSYPQSGNPQRKNIPLALQRLYNTPYTGEQLFLSFCLFPFCWKK